MRFANTGADSFYGDFFYDGLIPADDFYRDLARVIPWDSFAGQLLDFYKGKGEFGRPPYHPVMMLKVLVLGRLLQRSLRELQEEITFNLRYKFFIGLAANLPCPDFTTISDFQMRLLADRKRDVLAEILDEIIAVAQKSGIHFGEVQIVDSTHVAANVNTAKDEARKGAGQKPRDPDAEWGVKHRRIERDADGKKVKRPEYFYGYKMHMSMNSESGLITGIVCTGGKQYDGHKMEELIRHDLKLGLGIRIVTADRGYDDTANHFFLKLLKLWSAIRLNDYRLGKRDPNKQPWEELIKTAEYYQGLAQRGRIESKFGEAKTRHGLRRCCHVGLRAFSVQAKLTVLAMNLKRMVHLLDARAMQPGRPSRIAV